MTAVLRTFCAIMRDVVQQRREAAEHNAWFRRQVRSGLGPVDAGHLFAAKPGG